MSTTDELAIFVKVVEEGSFTAASRALQVPKSSISRYIARLEDRLGVRLLNRTTRSLSTTDVGAAFYERCVRIVAEIAEAEASITSAVPRGPLRVAVPVRLGAYIGSRVPAFLRQYPGVLLQITSTDRVVDLLEDGIDLAVRRGPIEDPDLHARLLPNSEPVLCASPDYLRRRGTPAEPAALQDHDCLLTGTRATQTWWFGDGVGVKVSGPLAINSCTAIHQAACEGLGVAMLPRCVVADAVWAVCPGVCHDPDGAV